MSNGHEISIEFDEARLNVEIAKADLRDRVHEASETSKRLVKRVTTRPALVLVAGLGAIALAVGLFKIAQGRRRANRWRLPKRRSLLGEALRSAALSLAARLAAAALSRLQFGPTLELSAENPRRP